MVRISRVNREESGSIPDSGNFFWNSHLAREVQGGALKMLCVVTLVGSNPTDGINETNSTCYYFITLIYNKIIL